jgi:hypothetical protein
MLGPNVYFVSEEQLMWFPFVTVNVGLSRSSTWVAKGKCRNQNHVALSGSVRCWIRCSFIFFFSSSNSELTYETLRLMLLDIVTISWTGNRPFARPQPTQETHIDTHKADKQQCSNRCEFPLCQCQRSTHYSPSCEMKFHLHAMGFFCVKCFWRLALLKMQSLYSLLADADRNYT